MTNLVKVSFFNIYAIVPAGVPNACIYLIFLLKTKKNNFNITHITVRIDLIPKRKYGKAIHSIPFSLSFYNSLCFSSSFKVKWDCSNVTKVI